MLGYLVASLQLAGLAVQASLQLAGLAQLASGHLAPDLLFNSAGCQMVAGPLGQAPPKDFHDFERLLMGAVPVCVACITV